MKILQSLLLVLAVLAVFGTTRGEGEGGDIQCPVFVEEGVEKASGYREFKRMHYQCLRVDGTARLENIFQGANTSEEFSEVVKGFCAKSSTRYECLARTNELASRCLPDPIEAGKMNVQAKFIELMIRMSCERDGTGLVPILMEIFSEPESTISHNFLEKCVNSATDNVDFNSATVSQFNLQLYQVLTSFKTCMLETMEGREETFEDSINFLNHAGDVMLCMDEESGNETYCKNIAERKCANYREVHSKGPELYESYSTDVFECYMQVENSSRISRQLKEAHSAEEYQTVIKDICRLEPRGRQCILITKVYAELCLQARNLDIFKGTVNVFEIVHAITCEDEGVRLSNILAAIRSTLPADAKLFDRCLTPAVDGLRNELEEDRNYRLVQYHAMKNFTDCIEDYGRDHNQAVVDAATFFGAAVGNLACLDKDGANHIPCSRLTDNL